MPRYRFIFADAAPEIEAPTLMEAYDKLSDEYNTAALIKVECGVEPFHKPKTLFVEEQWDEWAYRLEIDEEAENYEDVVSRLWINSRFDGSGYWVEMPHNYDSRATGAKDPSNAASIVEKYADEYWKNPDRR